MKGKIPIIVLACVVAIGLSAYVLTCNVPFIGPPVIVNPMTLEMESPTKTKPQLSKQAKKVLKKKLEATESMAKTRKEWVEESEGKLAGLDEAIPALPKESGVRRLLEEDRETERVWLEQQRKKLAKDLREMEYLKEALGGK